MAGRKKVGAIIDALLFLAVIALLVARMLGWL